MRPQSVFRTVLLLVLGGATAIGCSSKHDYGPTGTVSGRLTMDGKPLPEGTKVMFMEPREGWLAFGATDADGRFAVKSWNNGNMPVGTYKVMIQPAEVEDTESLSADDLLDRKKGNTKTPLSFPKRYRAITTSKLEYKIDEGANTFDIDIKSK
jgi:hypothetical protein